MENITFSLQLLGKVTSIESTLRTYVDLCVNPRDIQRFGLAPYLAQWGFDLRDLILG